MKLTEHQYEVYKNGVRWYWRKRAVRGKKITAACAGGKQRGFTTYRECIKSVLHDRGLNTSWRVWQIYAGNATQEIPPGELPVME